VGQGQDVGAFRPPFPSHAGADQQVVHAAVRVFLEL
jgi:hypothetical protein